MMWRLWWGCLPARGRGSGWELGRLRPGSAPYPVPLPRPLPTRGRGEEQAPHVQPASLAKTRRRDAARHAAMTLIVLTAALLTPPRASAQDWPARLVRIIVPAAAGGSSDAAARLVANHFQAVFRQPFIIENKPGNGNALGAAFVAQAEPDGQTLLLSNSASNLTVPLVAGNAGYDPVTDFSHIVMLTSSPYIFAVYPGLRVNTLAAFVAKARDEKLAYTAANRGGLGNIGGEHFQRLAGISLQHVPYRGGGPAVAGVIAGQVPARFLPRQTVGEDVRSGALVALAVTTEAM